MLARDASRAAEVDERLFELVRRPAMVVFIFARAASILIEEFERLLLELFCVVSALSMLIDEADRFVESAWHAASCALIVPSEVSIVYDD
jgi:hypothetical protein